MSIGLRPRAGNKLENPATRARIAAAVLAAAALAAPAAAAAAERPVDVRVSLYGVQRWATNHHEHEEPGACFDDRGDYTERTVTRFRTTRSVRMRLDSGSLRPITPRGWSFERMASHVEHSVEGTREVKEDSCTEWKPFPITTAGKACRGDVAPVASSIVGEGGGRMRYFGGIDGTADSLPECDWGDRSGDLYDAKGRLPIKRLRAREEVDLILRGATRDDAANPDGSGTVTVETRTTVYVKLRPVGLR
jgi:hypothetical protein